MSAIATTVSTRRRWVRRLWRALLQAGIWTVIVGLVSGGFAAATWYFDRQAEAQREEIRRTDAFTLAVRESQKPFLEKQLAYYLEAAKVTGKLATLPPVTQLPDRDGASAVTVEDWAWAHKRFYELYWGELGVVESPEVARAMIDFRSNLTMLESCLKEAGADCTGKQETLTGSSISLAHSVRASLEKGWGYGLTELPPRSTLPTTK